MCAFTKEKGFAAAAAAGSKNDAYEHDHRFGNRKTCVINAFPIELFIEVTVSMRIIIFPQNVNCTRKRDIGTAVDSSK